MSVEAIRSQLLRYGKVTLPSLSEHDLKRLEEELKESGLDVAREGNTLVLKASASRHRRQDKTRVSISLRQDVVDALLSAYDTPVVANAVKMAIYDALRAKGYNVSMSAQRKKSKLPDVDEVL